jgi:hypothetical protein
MGFTAVCTLALRPELFSTAEISSLVTYNLDPHNRRRTMRWCTLHRKATGNRQPDLAGTQAYNSLFRNTLRVTPSLTILCK